MLGEGPGSQHPRGVDRSLGLCGSGKQAAQQARVYLQPGLLPPADRCLLGPVLSGDFLREAQNARVHLAVHLC